MIRARGVLSPLLRSLVLVALCAGALGALPLVGCGLGGNTSLCMPEGSFPEGVWDGPMVGRPTASSMTIGWRSVAPRFGSVSWGADATYGATVAEATASIGHEIVLSPLSPATVYHFRIEQDGTP